MAFTFTIQKNTGFATIALGGSLFDKGQATELYEQLDELIANKTLNYLVDLKELTNLSSGGIQVLLHILTAARNRGGEVLLTNPPERIHNLLTITKLDTIFTQVESPEAAETLFKQLT